jgi:hypothetical protein
MAPSLRRPKAVTSTAPRPTRAPEIVYACSLIDLDITSLTFYPLGSGLTVTGFPVSRTDRVSGNAFSVRGVTSVSAPFGFVTETHSLNGMFQPVALAWTGTLQLLVNKTDLSPTDCTSFSHHLDGVRNDRCPRTTATTAPEEDADTCQGRDLSPASHTGRESS